MAGSTANTAAWEALKSRLGLNSSAVRDSYVEVGIIAEKGGNATQDGISMIELAAIHEFGSPAAGIPERSFIRSTFTREKDALRVLCAKLARAYIHGMPLSQALGLLGAWGVGQIKTTIRGELTTGPEEQANAPATIAKKGSSTPLVDTGRLINALSWLVKLAGGAS